MARIWSEEGKLARWLDVELAALDGWAEVGAVPGRRRRPRSARTPATPTAERVAEIEETTDHDLAAFVDAVAEQLGPEGRWVHYGLTSSDVVDTALALQLRDAGELVLRGIDRALAAVVAARRGAPPHDLHRPLARHPRRADDVRLEARRLGVRARPGARPARARARAVPRRPAVGDGRHLRRDRPGGGADRVRASRSRARPGVDAGDRARPARRAAGGARPLRHVAGPIRDRDPPPCPHRGARGRGAVRGAA